MLFWIREIAGWLLVLLGLFVMYFCMALIESKQVVGAFLAAGMGIFVFRGGIQLIKVSAAGRAVLQAQRMASDSTTPRAEK